MFCFVFVFVFVFIIAPLVYSSAWRLFWRWWGTGWARAGGAGKSQVVARRNWIREYEMETETEMEWRAKDDGWRVTGGEVCRSRIYLPPVSRQGNHGDRPLLGRTPMHDERIDTLLASLSRLVWPCLVSFPPQLCCAFCRFVCKADRRLRGSTPDGHKLLLPERFGQILPPPAGNWHTVELADTGAPASTLIHTQPEGCVLPAFRLRIAIVPATSPLSAR